MTLKPIGILVNVRLTQNPENLTAVEQIFLEQGKFSAKDYELCIKEEQLITACSPLLSYVGINFENKVLCSIIDKYTVREWDWTTMEHHIIFKPEIIEKTFEFVYAERERPTFLERFETIEAFLGVNKV